MPHDLGFGVPRQKKTAAFVGDRSLHTENANRTDRKQLEGLRVPSGAAPLPTGTHIVDTTGEKPRSIGDGVAVSDMTGGFAALELSGPRALKILKTGTELDLTQPSGTVMRRFHRQEIILYRWQADDTFRLHVQRGQLEAIWKLLSAFVSG